MKRPIFSIFMTIMLISCFISCNKSSAEEQPAELAESSVFIDLIMGSYSGRMFIEGLVSDEALETILQSGQKAPSAMNSQPWHFTVIKNSDIARQIIPRDYKEGAAVIVISGKPYDRPGLNVAFDAGLAAQNIYLAAQALGLGARLYFSGVQDINDNLKGTLSIPDAYEAQINILVGYLDPGADALTSASPRRPLAENVNYMD